MSREIKFRVWNGMEMVYDVTVGKFGAFYVNPENGNGLNPNDTVSLSQNTTKYHDNNPVMQFAGIKDKNGNEIYEGDIIKTGRNDDWGVIIYKAPFFEVTVSEEQSCMYTREWFANVETIGNIYQNPELLTN